MKISAINVFAPKNNLYIKSFQPSRANYAIKNNNNDTFEFSQNPNELNNKISFGGKPWELDYYLGDTMSASRAIDLFNNFELGNYLDITHRQWFKTDEPSYSDIRRRNLAFLDRVKSKTEKEKFVDYYKNLTGFPDLKKVSNNIELALVNSAYNASLRLKRELAGSDCADVVRIGYNDTCSVGKGKAFPGSDIDGAYIILNGTGSLLKDKKLVERYKGYLWEATDQRILSYNHNSAFPQVYTLAQIHTLLNKANQITNNMPLRNSSSFWNFMTNNMGYSLKYQRYKQVQGNYDSDFVAANRFFIDLCKSLPNRQYDLTDDNVSIEQMKNFGFMLESYRDGIHFTDSNVRLNPTVWADYDAAIRKSAIFDLVNLGQLKAYKNSGEEKPKLAARTPLTNSFNNWTIDKQYDLIKTIIKASCEENEPSKYPEYFYVSADNYEPLLLALGMER